MYLFCMATVDPALLKRLRLGVNELYGGRIERVVLFGSRARGDAQEDSDYDVVLFLRGLGPNIWDDLDRIAQVTQPILEESGVIVNVVPIGADKYANLTPLMHEIRRDGLEL
jgi:predicted nucleotidyltransferase